MLYLGKLNNNNNIVKITKDGKNQKGGRKHGESNQLSYLSALTVLQKNRQPKEFGEQIKIIQYIQIA